MALQDLIKDFNETQGTLDPAPQPDPAPESIKPEPTPEVKDEAPSPAPTIKPEEESVTPTPDPVPDVFTSRLSELTGGKVKSAEDFSRVMGHYSQLVEQAEKGFEPKFKDERAKLVYQLLEQNAGKEPEAAMRTLRALNFTREGKSEKDVLFEAYLLDPKNSDLTPIKAQEYFEYEYTQKYQDLEENPLRRRQLELEVRDALGTIEKVKSDFQGPEPVNTEKVEKALMGAIGSFGGVQLQFAENAKEGEMLNLVVDDPVELQAIQREILNPQDAYNEFLSQFDFNSPQGWEDFVRETYERRNHKEIRQKAYDQGIKQGQLMKINEIRNQSAPGDVSRSQPGQQKEKTLFEAWGAAAQR